MAEYPPHMRPLALKRLPRQSIKARKLARKRNDPVVAPIEANTEPNDELSLHEQFFPEFTQSKTSHAPHAREVPRIPVEVPRREQEPPLEPQKVLEGNGLPWEKPFDIYKPQYAIVCVRNASPNLIEDDFRRLAPKGKHIEDWTALGELLRVIPLRDHVTFERDGTYYLKFSNLTAARAYVDNVHALHALALQYTPTSLMSPLMPGPGASIHGEDIHALVHSYALYPPTQEPHVRLVDPPYDVLEKEIATQDSFGPPVPPFQSSQSRIGRVLLRIEGAQQPSLFELRHTFLRDTHERGLAWDIFKGEEGIRLTPAVEEGPNGQERSKDHRLYQRKRFTCMIDFVDEAEAKRFVRAWHRKPFIPYSRDYVHNGYGDQDPPLVYAELFGKASDRR
ncbi:hypothetical protein BDY21DRAFT_363516 [Lineolata rhizophorae]|uniref:Uncharacterized protein n=1 Tax=Lineolata rhizophorae TaxID=578093 RepID=A0A6A6P2G5_9PEZI|nr:hypothetical protein BDY21DRAFT_363516 [Lineolata rhizophorae]